jgi:transposase
MTRKAQPIILKDAETRSLKNLLSHGTASARSLARARILDLLHRGRHPSEIASSFGVSQQSVYNLKRRYLTAGLEAALFDQARAGRPIEISGAQRAKVTALACSTPPEGHSRWTLRLLADRAVELGYCASLSHTKARQILKKTDSNRTSKSNGVLGR